jgi:hypothetical protein
VACLIVVGIPLSAERALACTPDTCDGLPKEQRQQCKAICECYGYNHWNQWHAIDPCASSQNVFENEVCIGWKESSQIAIYVSCEASTSIGSFRLDEFIHKGVGGRCDETEGNLSATIEVEGTQYAQCINKGGNIAPGRREVEIKTSQSFASTECANGKFNFQTEVDDKDLFTLVEVPISSSPKDLGCPNGNWDLNRDFTGEVLTAQDEAGNPYTLWTAMNIHIAPERGGKERVSRACCYTTLEDANPDECFHGFCQESGVPDAAPDGSSLGELTCGIVWTSDQQCGREPILDADGNFLRFGDAVVCPAGSSCGKGGTCEAMECVAGVTNCPAGSECADGICVPECSS